MNELEKLHTKRKALGLTAEELGKRVGVTRQTIRYLETGKTKGSIPLIRVINWELDAEKGDRTWEEVLKEYETNLPK